MPDVTMRTHLPVSSDQVWRLIGGFNALPDWHPLVAKSELEGGGSLRKLTLPTGETIVEKLEHSDDDARTYTYSIVDSPLPVSSYNATIKVSDDADGKGCTVEWSSGFEASGDENTAIKAVQGIYEAGLQNLEKMFGKG